MTSPNGSQRRQIVVAGVQANVGTSVVVEGLRGLGYNVADGGVYQGGPVDILVAGAAMSNVAPAQQAIQRAERPPVLAIVADTDRSLPSRIREAWRMVRGLTRGNIGVPFVPEWRAQKNPPAQAAAAASDPRATRDTKAFVKSMRELGPLAERLADEQMPAPAPARRHAPQQQAPQLATVPSTPFQPQPAQASANWQQLMPAVAQIVDSMRPPSPHVPVAAAGTALGTAPSPRTNNGHLSTTTQLGNVQIAAPAHETRPGQYQGVNGYEAPRAVRVR